MREHGAPQIEDHVLCEPDRELFLGIGSKRIGGDDADEAGKDENGVGAAGDRIVDAPFDDERNCDLAYDEKCDRCKGPVSQSQ